MVKELLLTCHGGSLSLNKKLQWRDRNFVQRWLTDEREETPAYFWIYVEQLLYVIHNQADIYWFLVHQKLLTQIKQN